MPTVSFQDIENAAQRLANIANKTPVFTSRTVNQMTKAEIFFKCENFQRTGSFKFRGAYNAMSQLSEEQKKQGVLTYSSGNHAQAIALAGRLLKVATTIVMPYDAPQTKLIATRGYGADVITYDRCEITREKLGQKIAIEKNLTIIPPYDHAWIIAGQGTVVKELIEEVGPLDVLLAPCGGGGLLAGSSISANALSPKCRVIGIEPENADDAARSFATGKIQSITNPETIADGARTPSVGVLNFSIIRKYVDSILTMPDAQIAKAMFFLQQRLKLMVEPTGALATSALLAKKVEVENKKIGVVVSGGNVDISTIADLFKKYNS